MGCSSSAEQKQPGTGAATTSATSNPSTATPAGTGDTTSANAATGIGLAPKKPVGVLSQLPNKVIAGTDSKIETTSMYYKFANTIAGCTSPFELLGLFAITQYEGDKQASDVLKTYGELVVERISSGIISGQGRRGSTSMAQKQSSIRSSIATVEQDFNDSSCTNTSAFALIEDQNIMIGLSDKSYSALIIHEDDSGTLKTKIFHYPEGDTTELFITNHTREASDRFLVMCAASYANNYHDSMFALKAFDVQKVFDTMEYMFKNSKNTLLPDDSSLVVLDISENSS